ncbi:glutamine synthetase family protein [Nitratireductor aquibiodomus]|uniref:glutamine synthetase family protein n=1 Tax=Nitratireductor aquibiodomus TaxID=204799 RepID=UPI0004683FD4|nr:glutamine synthetase family protein [Nitratireductor aquibiodomus]
MDPQENIILAVICDYGARVRGKGFRAKDAEKIQAKGVGLAYSNLMITSLGEIVDSPWGPRGDVLMMPDPGTKIHLQADGDFAAEQYMLSDLVHLDGTPWECCPRNWLRRGIEMLREEFGLSLFSAFEHEFHYSGILTGRGSAYGLDAWRFQNGFGQHLVSVLDQCGLEPEMIMAEYAPQQLEIVNAPALGVTAADRAVQLREITRALAHRRGEKATFAPIMPGGTVGNGVHIHFSLQRDDGSPCSYDPDQPYGLSTPFGHFISGVLAHMNDFVALTAASDTSYERLQPNLWSASYNNLGKQDREAGVRICPLSGTNPEKSFNVEYRAADATANPYLALGAIVWSGIDGLRNSLTVPEATDGDLSQEVVTRLALKKLPASLSDALDLLQKSAPLREWMGSEFLDAYLMNKRSELKLVSDLDFEEKKKLYASCF